MRTRSVFFVLVFGCLPVQCTQAQVGNDLVVAFPNLAFDRPVDLQHAGDGSGRLFVVEQEGLIRVFANDPEVPAAGVFLDIQDRVQCCGEQGLLGLAFHPSYADNGRFFVYYSAGSGPRRSVLARYGVDPADPNRADPGSEEILLEVPQPYSNHNAGQIRFGPDGYLYVALGDGGNGGDPEGNGQDRTTLLGSILRLDVDQPTGGRGYGIPPDNPFAGNTDGFREEIYAYGLRNPWRFSFDPDTGRLWAADVGQDYYEEIDIIESGGNYGWDCREGMHAYNGPRGGPSPACESATGFIEPVHEYTHAQGQSVTGGFVYRGPGRPDLAGQYIYADYLSGRIWALTFDGTAVTDNRELLDTGLTITSFGVDEHDELYLCDFGSGRIYRFVPVVDSRTGDAETPSGAVRLSPNHPNPFRETTTIAYTLAQAAQVLLVIYDLQGRLVRTLVDGPRAPGAYSVRWDGQGAEGRPVADGVYVYRMHLDGTPVASRRMVLAR